MKKMLFALLVRIENHWLVPLLLLLFVATALWVIRLADPLNDVPLDLALAKGLFFSLQFIVLNKEVDSSVRDWVFWGLTLMQFALPLLASFVVLGKLFRDQMRPIWVRRYACKNLKEHHIVVGYGELGKALVRELTAAQKDVIAVDIQEIDHEANDHLIILHGDARSPVDELFAGGQLNKASCLYLLLPDENENLRLLDRLQEHFKENKPDRPIQVHLRTETHALGQLFADWVGLASTHGESGLDVRAINPYDIVARGVVNLYSPDCYVPTDKEGPIAQTIMIVGTSRMAQSLLLRFARIGIYAPKGKLRILWVGDDVLSVFWKLRADFPLLDAQHCPPKFWGADEKTDYFRLNLPPVDLICLPGRAESLLRAGTIKSRCDGELPAAIYVCHDSDIRNIKEARDLQAALGADSNKLEERRLILALQDQATIKAKDGYQWMRYEIRQAVIDENFASTIVRDNADYLAERIKIAYDKAENQQSKKTDSKPPVGWKALSYFEKESNRDAADHGAIKARYAGLDCDRVCMAFFEAPPQIIPELETIMRKVSDELIIMEQRRYRAFMFMMGFRYVKSCAEPKGVGKNDWRRTQRINPTLLEEKLSDYEKGKDTNIVRITSEAFCCAKNK